ncbi:MAG: ATP-binding protein [Leptospiraceae bacterium]|nr:ATP-binding protein [Leptospiraceae bacterium]MDW8305785.1 ATP-binding protein [Leptospiraceae bacterium]
MEQRLFLLRKKIPVYFYNKKIPFSEIVVVDPELATKALSSLLLQDVVLFFGTKSDLDQQIARELLRICPGRWIMVLEKSGIHAIRSAYEGGAYKVLFADEIEIQLEETLQKLQEHALEQAILNLPKEEKKSHLQVVESITRLQQLDDVREIVRRLRDNLAQHGGFGAVLSAAEIMEKSAEKLANGFLVAPEVFLGFVNSSRAASRSFNAMNYFLRILDRTPEVYEIELREVFDLWESFATSVAEKASLAGIKLIITREMELPRQKVRADREVLRVVYQEALINALKFSFANDTVIYIPVIRKREYGFYILNMAHEFGGVLGIPPEYQQRVFEALFKLQEVQDHPFAEYELTAGLGLGLTMIERLIKRHNGQIQVRNMTTHSLEAGGPTTRVMTEVLFPFEHSSRSGD